MDNETVIECTCENGHKRTFKYKGVTKEFIQCSIEVLEAQTCDVCGADGKRGVKIRAVETPSKES